MRLEELGEFGLIARLTSGLPTRPDVALGVGDDAAVLDLAPDADAQLVATCDAQVAGRHFLLGVATPEEIGHKALAVNLSDIASMGAEPLWALVSLVVPPALDVAVLDGVYAGMRALAGRFGVALVGGNVAAAEGPLVVDVTLLGRVARGAALRRAGGHAGDALLVTGTLGAAAAGVLLALAAAPGEPGDALASGTPTEARTRARAAQVAPEPRVAEGRALAASGAVTAMVDVSDGLLADLGHMCEASGVGAELDAAAIPVDPAAAAVAAAYGRDALDLALGGGEDYELLFAARPDGVERARAAARRAGADASVIGRLVARGAGEPPLRLRDAMGHVRPLEPRGWDHLAGHTAGRADSGGG